MKNDRRWRRRATICGLVVLSNLAMVIGGAAARAQDAVADHFRGKTIDMYIGYATGGGYDAYGRLVARFLGDFLPGKPKLVPRNMPGGGGRVLAGYMFNVAPHDGTALAMADQSLVLQQAIGDPTILFDSNKLNWIGNPAADNNTIAVWSATGVKTFEDATRKEVVIGATGPNTSSQMAQLTNALLGTKFKIVSGYPGGNDINLAMEKGEVGGRASSPWATWKATRPDWVRDGKIIVIAQIGLTRAPDLPDVPLLTDLARNDEDRAVIRLISAPATIGRPVFTTPGVPEATLRALRQGFDAMVKYAPFNEEAAREKLDINPVSGEELQKIVHDLVATPKPIAERLAAIIKSP